MLKEENLIFILPFIFLIFKLLLNCINNYTEETLIDDNEETLTDESEESETDDTEETLTDDTEETLTDDTEETLTDESEETLTDESEETLTDKSEKDDNKESEEDSDKELDDYTNSRIIKLKINNKIEFDLNYKSIIRYIYENEIKDGFRIIKNTLFKDIKTIKKEDKGYYYLEKIGISVRFKNANDSFNEIINQCEINNISLYMKIELFDGEIKKIKI
jgi:hypothetical protein